jgi:prevent-host-death family protein
MARQINLYEAKTSLSRLVDEAAKGNDVIIAKNGKAMARLTGIATAGKSEKRKFGQWNHLLTPEERRDIGSPSWWRRWKEADAEIERDFERSLAEDGKEFESQWPVSSSTPTFSSGQKKTPAKSTKKRSKQSARRKTGSL